MTKCINNTQGSVYTTCYSIPEAVENLYEGLDTKTDLYGDHKGTWQGLSKPTLTTEGAAAQVEKNVAEIQKLQESKVDKVEGKALSTNDYTNSDKALVAEVPNKMNKGESIKVSQIDKNQGKIDQTYLADSLLQQITGGASVNATPADNSITESKLDPALRDQIDQLHLKIYGGITKYSVKTSDWSCTFSTTSTIAIYDKLGYKWSFTGVEDYKIGDRQLLVADITSYAPGSNIPLTLLPNEASNTRGVVVIAGNFYGKIFSDATLNLQDTLGGVEAWNAQRDQITTKSSSLVAMPYNATANIFFDATSNELTLEGAIYCRKRRTNRASFIIPSFTFYMGENDCVYVSYEDIEASTEAMLPLSAIKRGTVFSDYDPDKHVALFWRSRNHVGTSTGMPIKTKGTDSKKVVCFGDSLTELMKYPEVMADLTGDTVYDVSFAGAVMSYHQASKSEYETLGFMKIAQSIKNGDFTPQQTAVNNLASQGVGSNKQPNLDTLKSIDWNEIDKAVVLLGTNDYGASACPLEGQTRSFAQGIRAGVEAIMSVYPHIQLYFVSPPWRGGGTNPNDLGLDLLDYVDKIGQVSEEYNFPFYDMYRKGGINAINNQAFLVNDELHLNTLGQNVFAEKIGNFIGR